MENIDNMKQENLMDPSMIKTEEEEEEGESDHTNTVDGTVPDIKLEPVEDEPSHAQYIETKSVESLPLPFNLNSTRSCMTQEDWINYHQSTQPDTEILPFQCSFCRRSFRLHADLSHHVRTRAKSRPQRCPEPQHAHMLVPATGDNNIEQQFPRSSHTDASLEDWDGLSVKKIKTEVVEAEDVTVSKTDDFDESLEDVDAINHNPKEMKTETVELEEFDSGQQYLEDSKTDASVDVANALNVNTITRENCELEIRSDENLWVCGIVEKLDAENPKADYQLVTSTFKCNESNKIEYDRLLGCNFCGETFDNNSPSSLVRHVRVYHNYDTKETCAEVNTGEGRVEFDSQRRHLHRRSDSEGKPVTFPCDLCDRSFKTYQHLTSHRRTHTGEKPYLCDICPKRFPRIDALNRHKRWHAERPYQCGVCEKMFAQADELSKHEGIHTNENRYKCEQCSKAFKTNMRLTLHIRSMHMERPFSCDVCDKRFVKSWLLAEHQRTHTGQRPFSCEICNKTFTSSAGLGKHKLFVHSGARNFQCEVCGMSFIRSWSLASHSRIHTGEKPYECEYCPRKFRTKADRAQHQRTHTGEKPFKCDICDKVFAISSSLSKHRVVHKEDRQYKCQVCDKVFKQGSGLASHRRIHTGEKPYKCEYCDKTFSCPSYRVVHRRTHTGEKPFTCDECDKAFTSSSSLNDHRRRKHRGNELEAAVATPLLQ